MRLVSPDALSADESQVFELYKRVLPPSAVCVNVMVCDEPWDIRPLVLAEGRVWLYRFSRSYDQKRRRELVQELEGFAAIPGWQWRVQYPPVGEQFFAIRPYFSNTVRDLLLKGELSTGGAQRGTVDQLIQAVISLNRRNLVHGHISLANMAMNGEKVVLLDPAFGILNDTRDEYRAPESDGSTGEPAPAVDIYGLGRCIRVLLADALVEAEREIVERMLLPSPRQRPSLEEIVQTFTSYDVAQRPEASVRRGTGKLVSKGGLQALERQEASSRGGESPEVAPSVEHSPRVMRIAIGALGVTALGLGILKWRFPATYYEVSRYIPLLVAQDNAQYEASWSSGDKVRMATVARAAIVERDPAAENVIIDDIMSGGKPPFVVTALMQLAFSDLWRDSLSRQDERAAIALSLAPLFPQGIKQIPPLSQLHPALIVAAAGQMSPTDPSPQLMEIPITTTAELPEPIGPLFKALHAMGVKTMADPEAVGLSAIIAGNPMPSAVESYIGVGQGREIDVEGVLVRLALISPLLLGNEPLGKQVLATIRDEGGGFGQVVSWFDIDYLAKWSTVPAPDRLLLLLQKLPPKALTLEQYADLLAFPLAGVRKEAVTVLKTKFFKEGDGAWLNLLGEEESRLTREQIVALVSALHLAPDKRPAFIAAWFALKPSIEGVVKLILARSHQDSSDLLNLEAARYLRQSGWKGGDLETLKGLAMHPEPLVRSLAYAYLNPEKQDQRKVLEGRITQEQDPALKNALRLRLGFDAAVGTPPPTSKTP